MEIKLLDQLEKEGIIKLKNFLNPTETKTIKEILNFYSVPKGHPKSYFSTSLYHFILKLIKLDIKKFKHDLIIYNLAKKKKLNHLADKVFKKKSYLKFIDGYHSPVSNVDVLPWHTDQAYHGNEKNYKGFVNPDHAHLKIFIYLTEIGPNNGCMSYIPCSHKIGYAIRKGIFENILKYSPYFTLNEFRNFLIKKENMEYIDKYYRDQNLVKKFLEKTKFAEENKDTEEFDYSLSPGDAIIFNEGGIHKGSKSLLNERLVLRYLYSIKKNNLQLKF